MNTEYEIKCMQADWSTNQRWKGIKRGYEPADVLRLRGTVKIEYSLASQGAEKLWRYMAEEPFVNSLGALTGNQAMQQVKAGLKSIYLSGWLVDQRPCHFIQFLAFPGQVDPWAVAFEQDCVKFALKCTNLQADRRLAEIQLFCCVGHLAALGDSAKRTKLF